MDPVYIGIDPTAGRRPMNYAVLDGQLRLLARGLGKLDKVLEVVQAYPAAVIAVDAPQSLNTGLMASESFRQRLGLAVDTDTWADAKVGEYELQRRGIRLYQTPGELAAAPLWMRVGFQLYQALQAEGYEMYVPGLAANKLLIEVHPQAAYTVLLGRLPLRKDTLEGRLQRQLVLFEEGLQIPDPMDSLEEITRHHLLEGTLFLNNLLHHDELDALVSAFTAHLVVCHPEHTTWVGEAQEGQIALPVAASEFREIYR